MNQDLFELEQLRIDPVRVTKLRRPKRWRRHYVNVPWRWVEQLRKTKRVCTYRVALLLLYEHWRTGGQPILLSNVGVREEGLARRSKWNAITELRDRGLIEVEAAPRKSPRITPLPHFGMSTLVLKHLCTLVLKNPGNHEHTRAQQSLLVLLSLLFL